jgi:hypothetical protein
VSACSLTLPDGTTVVPSLTNPSTGLLRLDYLTVQEGHHSGKVTATVASTVKLQAFEFDVVVSRALVSLADARARLNFTSTVSDEEMRSYIESATDYVEGLIGPVVRRTLVEKVKPADGLLFLSAPVISLTTITDTYGYGQTYNVANFLADGSTIYPLANTVTVCYPVTVTYVGGRVIVDPMIRDAALDYIKWDWESQRGASGSPFQGEGEFEPGVSATPPYRIAQKLQRYMPAVVA